MILFVRSSKTSPEWNSRRWIGSALYRCGTPGCGSDVRNSGARRGQAYYRCRRHAHGSIGAGEVDAAVLRAVEALLDRERGRLLLTSVPEVDVAGLRGDANTYRAQLDQYADERADGKTSDHEYFRMRDRVAAKLAKVETQLASVHTTSRLSGVADAPDPVAAFRALACDGQRAIVADLFTVTILPGQRGGSRGRGVDLNRVRIEPRRCVSDPATVAA